MQKLFLQVGFIDKMVLIKGTINDSVLDFNLDLLPNQIFHLF